jgi:SARP family transcriptional regulator, regulator of embCAB operon
MVATAPLRERRWEQLMLAQYRAGMRVDALASYGQARRVLTHGFGIEPGPGLSDLRRRISVDDRGLAWQPDHRMFGLPPFGRPVSFGDPGWSAVAMNPR